MTTPRPSIQRHARLVGRLASRKNMRKARRIRSSPNDTKEAAPKVAERKGILYKCLEDPSGGMDTGQGYIMPHRYCCVP